MTYKNIKLLVTVCHDETIKKKYGFKITSTSLCKMSSKWLAVIVNWSHNDDKKSHYIKYCEDAGYMWSMSEVSQQLSFTALPKNFKTVINVGLVSTNGKQLKYRPTYFQNTKYGVIVYFAPSSWMYAIDIDNPIETNEF